MMGELTASIAHELSQPLTAILSNVQAAQHLLENPDLDLKEIREILDDILSDDQRAGNIIRGLRNLLKKREMKFGQLDINDLVVAVIRLIHSDALIKSVSINTQLAADLPALCGDRIQLQQVLLNLALNALDAMKNLPISERVLTIATSRLDDDMVEVAVRDSGTGIPPDQLEKIFEPFVTNKSQGLGMGLAISHSIIEMHKGRIWVTNNHGRGATFRFVLPISVE
jgi:two-component system sensor kinase FixL